MLHGRCAGDQQDTGRLLKRHDVVASLEFQPQRHLHYAFVRERACVHAEGIRVVNSIAHGHSVETHAIGHVEDVPTQSEVDALRNGKALSQACVQRKIAVPSQWISRARFTGVGEAEGRQNRLRISECKNVAKSRSQKGIL